MMCFAPCVTVCCSEDTAALEQASRSDSESLLPFLHMEFHTCCVVKCDALTDPNALFATVTGLHQLRLRDGQPCLWRTLGPTLLEAAAVVLDVRLPVGSSFSQEVLLRDYVEPFFAKQARCISVREEYSVIGPRNTEVRFVVSEAEPKRCAVVVTEKSIIRLKLVAEKVPRLTRAGCVGANSRVDGSSAPRCETSPPLCCRPVSDWSPRDGPDLARRCVPRTSPGRSGRLADVGGASQPNRPPCVQEGSCQDAGRFDADSPRIIPALTAATVRPLPSPHTDEVVASCPSVIFPQAHPTPTADPPAFSQASRPLDQPQANSPSSYARQRVCDPPVCAQAGSPFVYSQASPPVVQPRADLCQPNSPPVHMRQHNCANSPTVQHWASQPVAYSQASPPLVQPHTNSPPPAYARQRDPSHNGAPVANMPKERRTPRGTEVIEQHHRNTPPRDSSGSRPVDPLGHSATVAECTVDSVQCARDAYEKWKSEFVQLFDSPEGTHAFGGCRSIRVLCDDIASAEAEVVLAAATHNDAVSYLELGRRGAHTQHASVLLILGVPKHASTETVRLALLQRKICVSSIWRADGSGDVYATFPPESRIAALHITLTDDLCVVDRDELSRQLQKVSCRAVLLQHTIFDNLMRVRELELNRAMEKMRPLLKLGCGPVERRVRASVKLLEEMRTAFIQALHGSSVVPASNVDRQRAVRFSDSSQSATHVSKWKPDGPNCTECAATLSELIRLASQHEASSDEYEALCKLFTTQMLRCVEQSNTTSETKTLIDLGYTVLQTVTEAGREIQSLRMITRFFNVFVPLFAEEALRVAALLPPRINDYLCVSRQVTRLLAQPSMVLEMAASNVMGRPPALPNEAPVVLLREVEELRRRENELFARVLDDPSRLLPKLNVDVHL